MQCVHIRVDQRSSRCYVCAVLDVFMSYSDLLQNPLIVPVKVLRGHQVVNKIGGHTH